MSHTVNERLFDLEQRLNGLCSNNDTRPLALHWTDAVTLLDAIMHIENLEHRIVTLEKILLKVIQRSE